MSDGTANNIDIYAHNLQVATNERCCATTIRRPWISCAAMPRALPFRRMRRRWAPPARHFCLHKAAGASGPLDPVFRKNDIARSFQNRSFPVNFILLILVLRNAFRSKLRPERSTGYKSLDRLLDLKIQWLMRLAAPDALLIRESAWIASGP